jgi:hypothetical protein
MAKKKKKPTSGRQTAAPKKAPVLAKKTAKIAAKKPAAGKRPKKAAAAKPISLGRPAVTGDEPLYLLFREDYHARQIFEFLRVETVKELEQHSPQEIIKRLSQPITQTVERIRTTLAHKNRCLAGDKQFAVQHKTD